MPSTSVTLILASASPRRKELLTSAGFLFDVHVANIVEEARPGEKPEDYVLRNAREKGLAVMQKLPSGSDEKIIISADTIVVSPGNQILEKPSGPADALRMLRLLQSNTHFVFTGFALVNKSSGTVFHQELVKTKVKFRTVSDAELNQYIASGEPFDKAGGYGAQGMAASFVESIEGSYTNVVGLPLAHVCQALRPHLS